jgi:hypothetical protein
MKKWKYRSNLELKIPTNKRDTIAWPTFPTLGFFYSSKNPKSGGQLM